MLQTITVPVLADGDAGEPDEYFLVNLTNASNAVIDDTQGVGTITEDSACAEPPAGMVSWWRWEDDAADYQANNPATLSGAPAFVTGKVGKALQLDGTDDHASVAASPSLNVGADGGFTLDMWVKPSAGSIDSTERQLAEWNKNTGDPDTVGAHLGINVDSGEAATPGALFADIVDTTGASHRIATGGAVLSAGGYQHVALTYDKATGAAVIYVNGVAVATESLGTFTPQTSYDLYFGVRQAGAGAGTRFGGEMDEVELFGRALSAEEVKSIYDAGSAGKCHECVGPVSGVVSWWAAEGNAADIQGTNEGALVGDASFAPGKVGQAFSFDGNGDAVTVPHSGSLDLSSAITIEAWVKVDSFTKDWQAIVTKGDSAWRLHRFGDSNNVAFGTSGLTTGNGGPDLAGATDVADGQWHHVVGTYDGTTKALYVDGALDASTTASGLISTNAYPVMIGENAELHGRHFDGLIDEVVLYDRALSAEEVEAAFNAGGSGKCRTDLSINKTTKIDPVYLRRIFSYNLSVKNLGNASATGVSVSDTLPAGVAFVDAEPSQGTCVTGGGGTVDCDLGSLSGGGAEATVRIRVRAQATGTLTNTATVSGNEADSNPSNNSVTTDTQSVAVADVAVAKVDSNQTVALGDNITYTVRLLNRGPSPATGIDIIDTIPTGTTFVSASTNKGVFSSLPPVGGTGTLTANISNLAPDGTAEITIVVKPGAAGEYHNHATVTANETDPDSSNNSAHEATVVVTLRRIMLTPQTVAGGCSTSGQVFLTGPAPPGGITVSLSSTVPSATPPPTVNIPEGANASAPFGIPTSAVTQGQTGSIKATLSSTTVGRGLTVTKGTCSP